MKVVFNYDGNYKIKKPVAIALGTFDGIHIGHQELIKSLQEQKKKGFDTVVYTFLTHPMALLSPDNTPPQIMQLREKIKVFSDFGIDHLVLNPFDSEFKNQSHEQFLSNLLEHFNVQSIIVGFNFRFGNKGIGDTEYLRMAAEKFAFDLVSIDPVNRNDLVVSSSLVRTLISAGQVRDASLILGRPYQLAGKVVRGFGRGKKLGFPTANIEYTSNKLIPKIGIYAVECWLGNISYKGVTSIGYNPTFEGKNISVETYIIDYSEEIYGRRIIIHFIDRIRDEIKFNNPEELSRQIEKDVTTAINMIYKIR